MRNSCIVIFLAGLCSFMNIRICYGQDNKLSYQIILESKLDYQKPDKSSLLNPGNCMNIKDFSSLSELYPSFTFENRSGVFHTLLQTEANIRNYNFEKDSTEFSFQELFVQLAIRDKHYFVFGKKRLNWGTGIIWNPTNFHIQKDPLRTQNRLEGIFMFNYTWLINNHALNIYVFPDKRKKEFSYAAKYDFTGNRIDASLSYLQYKTRSQIGYDLSYGGDKFTFYSEGVGRTFSRTYHINDFYGLTPVDSLNSKFHIEWVGGGSFLLNQNFTFRGEYRYRVDYMNKEDISLFKAALPGSLILYDALSVGKHTLFCSLDYMDTYDRWSVSLRSFFDPASRQWMISPLGVWKKDNLQIELSAMLFNNALPIYDVQTSLLISYYF